MTATQRWAREDIEFGGKQIHRGDYIVVVLASANHDHQEFEHAEILDVTRKENAHRPLARAFTIALEHHLPAWKVRSRSGPCSCACRTCALLSLRRALSSVQVRSS